MHVINYHYLAIIIHNQMIFLLIIIKFIYFKPINPIITKLLAIIFIFNH